MALYKVSFEIAVTATNPLEAAKTVQEMLQESNSKWQYYVQEENKKPIFSIDLDEDDEDAVLPADNYYPSIEN